MLTSIVGPTIAVGPGEEVEMDNLTAHRLIASGQAEQVLPPSSGEDRTFSKSDWALAISPAEYLHRFPMGPNADRARQLLGLPAPSEAR